MIPTRNNSNELTPRTESTLDRVRNLNFRMRSELRVLTGVLDQLVSQLAQVNAINDKYDAEAQQRRAIKRSTDDLSETGIPNKMSKVNDEVDVYVSRSHRSFMKVFGTRIDRSKTMENLHKWLAEVYYVTAKFYTVQKSSAIGTFILYITIDVTLDEAKNGIHVIINSDRLHDTDAIYQFIQDCFYERKVVTLLHIIADDLSTLRENDGQLKAIIKTMMEPIVAHL